MKRITIGCYPSYVSLYFTNLIVKKYKLSVDLIIISTNKIKIQNKPIGLLNLKILYKRFGLKYIFYQLIISKILPFVITKMSFFFLERFKKSSFTKLSEKYKIPLMFCGNFNENEFIKKISSINSCVFVSMGLDQILQNKFISSFKECLNVHPSILPDFRGVDPIFEFLLTSEKSTGVTIHNMTNKIDKGNVVNFSRISRDGCSSHFSILYQSIKQGAYMFYDYIINDKKINDKDRSEFTLYPYKSWPTRKDIKKYNRCTKYFYIKDIIMAIHK